MKKFTSLFTLPFAALIGVCSRSNERPDAKIIAPVSIYSILLRDLDGNETTLEPYKGKKMLIVNVASKCGFTPQYKELQLLHEKYGDKLAVLGFPSNDFGKQEPGSSREIREFCTEQYHVTFPLFEKSIVSGKNKSPLYQWLSDKTQNGWNEREPKWNFCKYLVDENGQLLEFFPSRVRPMDEKLISRIR